MESGIGSDGFVSDPLRAHSFHTLPCQDTTSRLAPAEKEAGNCSKAGCEVEIQQHEECEASGIRFYSKLEKNQKESLKNGKFVKKNSKYLEYFAILNKMRVVQGIQVPLRALSPRMQHPCCTLRTGVSSTWAR